MRNSGATAVVEGVGDHCCEYMTGGTVVVLGDTGRNFAAGMSGGIAYVYDPKGNFDKRCNHAMVTLEKIPLSSAQSDETVHHNMRDEDLLKHLVSEHQRRTNSPLAKEILADWPAARGKFIKVFPHEYRRALTELAQGNKNEREAA